MPKFKPIIPTKPTTLGKCGLSGATADPLAGGVCGENAGLGPGVYGSGNSGPGVQGESALADGVSGLSHAGNKSGVFGYNNAGGAGGPGVAGWSTNGNGVVATSEKGTGLYAKGPTLAGVFDGNVFITGLLYSPQVHDLILQVSGLNDTVSTLRQAVGELYALAHQPQPDIPDLPPTGPIPNPDIPSGP